MAQGRIRKAVEKSIRHGETAGNIDLERDSAVIGMLRYMADVLDADKGGTPPLRYVTPASFLAYCEKLGFVPDVDVRKEKPKADKNTKLHVVGQSKWKRA